MSREFVIKCNPIFGKDAHLDKERQDPVFFEGSREWVLDIVYGEYQVFVYCDGETRAVYKPKTAGYTDLYATDDFISAGLDTDKKLYKAGESGKLEWINNPWFDMYGCRLEHLDCVTDTIEDAIAWAKKYLMERADSADIIMGVYDDLTSGL